VFAAGAAFSLRDGIDGLIHPSVTSSFVVAYVVLGVSAVFDLVSFRQSAGQMSGEAHRHRRELLEETKVTSEPSLRAVFVEDAVSVFGDVIALATLALNQITGSSIPQGVAAVLIALVTIRVSQRLVRRSHDVLVGSWLLTPDAPQRPDDDGFTQPLGPDDEQRIRAFVLGYSGVSAIRELLVTFVGQGQVWIIARVDIDDGLRGDQVKIAGTRHRLGLEARGGTCLPGRRRGHRRSSGLGARSFVLRVGQGSACYGEFVG
jgi:hypothetical protein